MLRFPLTMLALAAFALAAGEAGADVYKYRDDNGNVLYTDKPRTLPAERLNVQSQRTDVVAVEARQQAERERWQEATRASESSNAQRTDRKEAAELSAKDKAERCAQARERYDTYMNSQRLYQQDASGERRYLTSEELDAARAAAKTSMDTLCQ